MPLPRAAAWAVLAASLLFTACAGGPLLGRSYEYEEELRLYVDGTARVDVSASIPALVALRGVELDPGADVDRDRVRRLFEGSGVEVGRVRASSRAGRRFVHVRLQVDDIRRLSSVAPFAWSSYAFEPKGEALVYRQTVGAAAGKEVGGAGWTGRELVAFRMHLPSVIVEHNAPSRRVERGNILTWEQPLAARLAGSPVDVQVTMESESILYSTLLLFGAAILLAAAAFAFVIWRVMRAGRTDDVAVRPGA